MNRPTNYSIFHCHSMLSTLTAGIDSVTRFEEYVSKAKECGMTAIGFSEHGNVFNHVHKKEFVEAAGLKFIFAIEAYLTETISEKLRDNYHVVLIAENGDAVHEILELVTKSFNRDDGHFFYKPRITFDELFNTSKHVMVSTACVASPLFSGTDEARSKYISFLSENKDRCYLEVQHHPHADTQKVYNAQLVELSKKYGIPLIAGTDTHCLNKQHEKARLILQKSKNITFYGEDDWDLSFKTIDELIDCYKEQGVLTEDECYTAIENTNKMADRIEKYEWDKSIKYPHIYDDPEAEFKKQINTGYKNNKYLHERYSKDEVKKRVNDEFEVYKKVGAIDFMLLETHVLNWEKQNGIQRGYGRGSVSGSLIAYILGITEMDSLKFNLNFFRFLNPSRITNSDIDVDYSNDDRERVKKFLLKDHLNIDNIHTSEIITFNTIALKGAIRDVCRALFKDDESKNYLDISDTICKNVEHDEEKMRDEYKEVFEYVDILNGCIVSCGTHPSGVLVTDFDIGKEYGLCTLSTTKYPVVCIDMHELDGLMCVKLDILGLDNIGVINNTCKMIGITRLNPDNVDLNDEDVWRDIREDTTAIFQWESESAQTYLKKFMSDRVIRIAKEHDPNFSYIKWFSFGNGLLRPGCAAYRDDVADGNYYDNGMEELNQFLSKEAGHICMQETIMQFLVKFCGYTEAMSDTVRRGIAKKYGTEKLLPEIEKSFIEYSSKHYDITEDKCKKIIKPFIQTIKDASSYAFSWNHSDAYSCVGYISGYLRYYYPLEFICAALNIFKDDQDKVIKLTRYAVHRDIKIIPIKFRHSLSEYTVDKENGVIYKGIESIKYLNRKIGKELYMLKDKKFDSFVDLLNVTKKICNSKQMEILIKLDFFSEFGNPNQLLKEMKLFNEYYGAKHISKNKIDGLIPYDVMKSMCEKETEKKYINVNYMSIIKYLASVETTLTPITDKLRYELECLGYIQTVCPELDDGYMYVIDVYGFYSKKNISVYILKTGEQKLFKVKKNVFESNPIKPGDFIDATDYGEEPCWSRDQNGQWIRSETKTETILKKYSMVR